jgi:hypothetical protein
MPRKKKTIEEHVEDLEQFESSIKSVSMDEASQAPMEEEEPQTKISKKESKNSKDIFLKPKRTIFPSPHPKTGKIEVFNEKFRKQYEYESKYVKFIAENLEIIGETISLWTRPYGGLAAQEWDVPTNKPVWGPRYLAEQIKRKHYSRFVMEDAPVSREGHGTYYGTMAVESKRHRLNAHPAPEDSSISFGNYKSSF